MVCKSIRRQLQISKTQYLLWFISGNNISFRIICLKLLQHYAQLFLQSPEKKIIDKQKQMGNDSKRYKSCHQTNRTKPEKKGSLAVAQLVRVMQSVRGCISLSPLQRTKKKSDKNSIRCAKLYGTRAYNLNWKKNVQRICQIQTTSATKNQRQTTTQVFWEL